MTNTDVPLHYYVPGSIAGRFTRQPTADEWQVLQAFGYCEARLGKRFQKRVTCRANGDGYWYTRIELLDAQGAVVGSIRDDNGPRGTL